MCRYTGTVQAASDWGAPHREWRVVPALPGSHEAALHDLAAAERRSSFAVDLRTPEARAALSCAGAVKLERAIGVIYRPQALPRRPDLRLRNPAKSEATAVVLLPAGTE